MKFPTFAVLGLILSGTSLAKTPTEYKEDGPIILPKVRRNDPRNDCSQDNCYRALDGRLAEASTFCPTFTAQVITATTSLGPFQTFCADSPSSVSSACSCLVPAPAATNTCHQDNCYRALDGRLPIAHKFCPTFTAGVVTATTGLGPFQTFCASDPSQISSACSCLIAPVCLSNGGFNELSDMLNHALLTVRNCVTGPYTNTIHLLVPRHPAALPSRARVVYLIVCPVSPDGWETCSFRHDDSDTGVGCCAEME